MPPFSTDMKVETTNEVDIALDPFPYNGTTTTCEALWMGVPVITLAGKIHAGRVGVSILTQMELTDLIANTPDDYVRIAVELANSPVRLSELRGTLRHRMVASPCATRRGLRGPWKRPTARCGAIGASRERRRAQVITDRASIFR